MERSDSKGRERGVAIVGAACRLPGGVTDLEGLWDVLAHGRDVIGEVPADRPETARSVDTARGRAGKSRTGPGGFLDDIASFDAAYFGISPREAAQMDPQHRLLLELAVEALDDAALAPERLAGSDTAVFVGVSDHSWSGLRTAHPRGIDPYSVAGGASSVAANRISHALDLRGPSMVVDTACSSSLVALDRACRALLAGESGTVLAGGVNVLLSPHPYVGFSQASMLSRRGRCAAFSADADGFVRAEGGGVVVLRRLADALADGDRVHGVLLGSGSNCDGRTPGLALPNGRAQERLLRTVYEEAGVSPDELAYLEAHGTGSPAGDPVEAGAVGRALGVRRSAQAGPLPIGSVKSNLGHLEPASGMAGLLKALLVLRHRAVPATLHAARPHPDIDFAALGLELATAHGPLRATGDRPCVGVNSFGFGGANAHAVVAAAPRPAEPAAVPRQSGEHGREAAREAGEGAGPAAGPGGALPVLVSARTERALARAAARLADRLDGTAAGAAAVGEAGGEAAVRDGAYYDVAYTACRRRGRHPHRAVVLAPDAGGAARELRRLAAGGGAGTGGPAGTGGTSGTGGTAEAADAGAAARGAAQGTAARHGRIALVFSGNGAQWPGMGAELLAGDASFRTAVEEVDGALTPLLGWSVAAELAAGHDPERAARAATTEVAQPLLFAVQCGLLAVLRAWGVRPAVVLGHSVGEVAAAHACGALTLAQAARVTAARSAVQAATAGRGRMAAVALPPAEAEKALTDLAGVAAGPDGRPALEIAGVNSPRDVTIAGPGDQLDRLLTGLAARGVPCVRLDLDHAFHTAAMDPVREPLAAALAGLAPGPAAVPLISTVTGAPVAGTELDAGYWWRNVREPVLFGPAAERAVEEGADVLLEVGPHAVLRPYLRRLAAGRPQHPVAVLSTLRRDAAGPRAVRDAVAAVLAAGGDVDWDRHFPRPGRPVPLPAYPWQRERHWQGTEHGRVRSGGDGRLDHPLLGERLPAATPAWRGPVEPALVPWLADHRISGSVVLPVTAHVEMALAAGQRALGAPVEVRRLRVERPLVVPWDDAGSVAVLLSVNPDDGTVTVAAGGVHGPDAEAAGSPAAEPLRYARCEVRALVTARPPEPLNPAELRERCPREMAAAELYALTGDSGVQYGPAFRVLEGLRLGDGEVLAAYLHDQADTTGPAGAGAYTAHPALLDGALQAGVPLLAGRVTAGESYLPSAIGAVRVHRTPAATGLVWVRERAAGETEVCWDIVVADEDGTVSVELDGCRMRRLGGTRTVPVTRHRTVLRAAPHPDLPLPPSPLPSSARLVTGAERQIRALLTEWRKLEYGRAAGALKAHIAHVWADALRTLLRRPEAPFGLADLVDGGMEPRHRRLAAALLPLLVRHGLLAPVDDEHWRLTPPGPPDTAAGPSGADAEAPEGAGGEGPSAGAPLDEGCDAGSWGAESANAAGPDDAGAGDAGAGGGGPVEGGAAAYGTAADVSWRGTLARLPAYLTEISLAARQLGALPAVLRGERDGLGLLLPEEGSEALHHFYDVAPVCRLHNRLVQALLREIVAHWPEDRPLRVLEVGAGTGGTTAAVLPLLPADRTSYCFTDVSAFFFSRARKRFAAYDFVEYRTFDVDEEAAPQGFPTGGFDLVIAANALHPAADLAAAVRRVGSLLAPGGRLLAVESHDLEFLAPLFGTLERFWSHTDHDLRPDSVLLPRKQWPRLLVRCGFTDVFQAGDDARPCRDDFSVLLATHGTRCPDAAQPAQPATGDAGGTVAAPAGAASPDCWLVVGEAVEAAQAAQAAQAVEAAAPAEGTPEADAPAPPVPPVATALADRLRADAPVRVPVRVAARPPADAAGWTELLAAAAAVPRAADGTDAPAAEGAGPARVGVVLVLDGDSPGTPAALRAQAVRRLAALRELGLAAGRSPGGRRPAVWLVTRPSGALPAPERPLHPEDAAAWGAARTLANEDPDLHLRRVSLERSGDPGEDGRRLAEELLRPSAEDEVVLTRSGRFVAREVPLTAPGGTVRTPAAVVHERRRALAPAPQARAVDAFRLRVRSPGPSFRPVWEQAEAPVPGPGEVVVEVRATALNHHDIMRATGLLPAEASEQAPAADGYGMECAGRVAAVGEGVAEPVPGDRVLALAPAAFASHALAPARTVARIPDDLGYAEAATMPVVSATVHHCLHDLARLAPGETVLVHGGAGGVGLATVQYAHRLGATVIATAGSETKRALLRDLGVAHVLDSRSLHFAEHVTALTAGRGVDVVVNSLAGDALRRSLELVRTGGRFVELGKRDIHENRPLPLHAFRRSIAFFGVDLTVLLADEESARGLFAQVRERIADGVYRPLPHTVFPAARVDEAFRLMRRSRHIGKVVVGFDPLDEPVTVELAPVRPRFGGAGRAARGPAPAVPAVPAIPAAPAARAGARPAARVPGAPDGRDAATYLVTGGLGGFGADTARWLADRGVRRMALVSRRGPDAPGAREVLERLRARGVAATAHAADVADPAAMRGVLDAVAAGGGTLRGVVHCAMHLDDAPLAELSDDRLDAVLAPKLAGAAVLDALTRPPAAPDGEGSGGAVGRAACGGPEDGGLDLFLLCSSAAAAAGNLTQAPYAAGNLYLEALARHRRAAGAPATVLAWGALADSGYVARTGLGPAMRRLGLEPLRPADALAAADDVLGAALPEPGGSAVTTVARYHWPRLRALLPLVAGPRYARLLPAGDDAPGGGTESLRARLAELPAAEAHAVLRDVLAARLADILQTEPERLDHHRTLDAHGLDSLMAAELLTTLRQRLDVDVPPMELLRGGSTLAGIATMLGLRLGLGPADAGNPPDAGSPADAGPRPPRLPAGDAEVPTAGGSGGDAAGGRAVVPRQAAPVGRDAPEDSR